MCLRSARNHQASGWRLKRWPNPTTSFRPCCHSLGIPLDAPPIKMILGSKIIDNENSLPNAAREVPETDLLDNHPVTKPAWNCSCLSGHFYRRQQSNTRFNLSMN